MKLQRVGFFKELPYGIEAGGSLSNRGIKLSREERKAIVSYLESGALFVGSPGLSRDQLSAQHEIVGPLHLLTDGVFIWPSDLVYYFSKYDVALPEDFLRHMESNHWAVSLVDVATLEM